MRRPRLLRYVCVVLMPPTELRLTIPVCGDSTKIVYNITPDLTREGGSIPVTLTFAEALGVNVLLLPMGRGDDGAQCVDTIGCPDFMSSNRL